MIRMLRAVALAALLALPLAGCDPAKALDACKFEAQKTYPGAMMDWPPPPSNDPSIEGFLASCMKTKGFERDGGAKDCVLTGEEYQAACYKRTGF